MWAAMREECENSLLQIDTIWRAVKRNIQAHTPIPKYMLQVTYNKTIELEQWNKK